MLMILGQCYNLSCCIADVAIYNRQDALVQAVSWCYLETYIAWDLKQIIQNYLVTLNMRYTSLLCLRLFGAAAGAASHSRLEEATEFTLTVCLSEAVSNSPIETRP
jgi:hypothetical protein